MSLEENGHFTSNQYFSPVGIGITVCVLISGYFFFRKNPRIANHLKEFGGPPTIPIFGNSLDVLCPHEEFLPMWATWAEKYGPVFSFWISNFIPYVGVMDAASVEKLLGSNVHIEKGKYDYSLFHNWLGTGLLTAPPKKWTTRRKLLTPSFHFKILDEFMPIFNEQAGIFVDCLKGEAGNGEKFNISPYIGKCTLDIICETAMGKKMNVQTSFLNKKYLDAVNSICEIITTKLFNPWYRIPGIYHMTLAKAEKDSLATLKGFTEKVIQGRKLERSQTSNKKIFEVLEPDNKSSAYGRKLKAFLDLILDVSENEEKLTDEDIREEVDTFMFEGHDTTSMSLGWTIFLLSLNPDCQKLVHKELDEIFSDNPERDVTTGDLPKLKYMEYCIKESLRLYPSVPFIMRQIHSDLKLDDGRVIPKGVTMGISIYFLHRNPKIYPDPLTFNPERFTLENSAGRHPYAFIPFSAGSRNCIGQKFALMEEKVVLAKFFRKYKVLAGSTLENVLPIPDVILRPKNGISVILQGR